MKCKTYQSNARWLFILLFVFLLLALLVIGEKFGKLWQFVVFICLLPPLAPLKKYAVGVIHFRKNVIDFDEFSVKYKSFQVVRLSKKKIITLETESGKKLITKNLSFGWTYSQIQQILTDLKDLNKTIIIDDIFENVINID